MSRRQRVEFLQYVAKTGVCTGDGWDSVACLPELQNDESFFPCPLYAECTATYDRARPQKFAKKALSKFKIKKLRKLIAKRKNENSRTN